jgi:hypothetical protein
MGRPEDAWSNTVEDAAAYERWRAQGDEPGDEPDYEPQRRRRTRCTCTSVSESPCDYCCGD